MAPSVDCLTWRQAVEATGASESLPVPKLHRDSPTKGAELLEEEATCLVPKHDALSGQVTRQGVRVRAREAARSAWHALLLRRVAPALAMALFTLVLWVSMRWSIGDRSLPLPSGVRRSDAPPRSRTSSSRWTAAPTTTIRSSKSLPSLPTFSPPQWLQLDAETERMMDIYCRGPLLHAVQMAGVFPDSKHFVDMPIKTSSSAFDVLVDFDRRRLAMTEFDPSQQRQRHIGGHAAALREFLDEHFDPPGSDLAPITPFDYDERTLPPLVTQIQDPELREWAVALHQLWRHLGRVPVAQVTSSYLHAKALDDPHLSRPTNVLIVPGGRFRESYYWDSYWIVQGLLVSDMPRTARGIVNNLLEYVAEFGFVPNGGRIYYLTRSQPPMLSDMVRLVGRVEHNASHIEFDASYLRSALPILEQEYAFWMQRGPGGHAVELERPAKGHANDSATTTTITHVLNRYVSNANHPRPESYREDMYVAAERLRGDRVDDNTQDRHGKKVEEESTECRRAKYFNDVIAAAESGWDFSSRWLRNAGDMRSIFTSSVVPVDLNAILHRVERNLMVFHEYLGHVDRAADYESAARARREAIDAVLWSDAHGAWKDWNLEAGTHSSVVSASDFAPLWAKAFDPEKHADRVHASVLSLLRSGLLQRGGIQATTTFTGQQWDAPNAWPPEQDMLVEGLLAANTPEAHELARDVAKAWVHTSLVAWRETGLMFEKYNATEIGGLGVGGEYFPQFGFGWTNGVILKFLTIHQNLLLP